MPKLNPSRPHLKTVFSQIGERIMEEAIQNYPTVDALCHILARREEHLNDIDGIAGQPMMVEFKEALMEMVRIQTLTAHKLADKLHMTISQRAHLGL